MGRNEDSFGSKLRKFLGIYPAEEEADEFEDYEDIPPKKHRPEPRASSNTHRAKGNYPGKSRKPGSGSSSPRNYGSDRAAKAEPGRFNDTSTRYSESYPDLFPDSEPEKETKASPSQQTILWTLEELTDTQSIIDSVIDGNSVIITMGKVNDNLWRRSIDILCGAAFALDATLEKSSVDTYLFAPQRVRVMNRQLNATRDDDDDDFSSLRRNRTDYTRGR